MSRCHNYSYQTKMLTAPINKACCNFAAGFLISIMNGRNQSKSDKRKMTNLTLLLKCTKIDLKFAKNSTYNFWKNFRFSL